MPIPAKELHSAARPLPERILEFLKSDPTNAYAIDEILVGVEGVESEATMLLLTAPTMVRRLLDKYVDALQTLVKERKLVVARVRDTQYFSIPQR